MRPLRSSATDCLPLTLPPDCTTLLINSSIEGFELTQVTTYDGFQKFTVVGWLETQDIIPSFTRSHVAFWKTYDGDALE